MYTVHNYIHLCPLHAMKVYNTLQLLETVCNLQVVFIFSIPLDQILLYIDILTHIVRFSSNLFM